MPDGILRDLLTLDDPTLALVRWWDSTGDEFTGDDRLLPDGLAAQAIRLRKHDVMLVTMPKPAEPAEALFTALVQSRKSAARRYFTLEHSISPVDHQPYTVFCEWTIDPDRHVNLGPGPAADPEKFLRQSRAPLNPVCSAAGRSCTR